ncbi:hypothetical protein MLD38_034464 [Melastoma candidum]|uniref:Uncharacterized protein n=1 Tax=Melastoma candidum TaxID=119954 RepID=A0ACB9MBW5_9MYRT|nr:hypothetical protein MLD38_034464 [Melastoma candidum]
MLVGRCKYPNFLSTQPRRIASKAMEANDIGKAIQAEDETEELTNQVLDEIGVDVASQLSAAPKGKVTAKQSVDVRSSSIDELEKRLAALRES